MSAARRPAVRPPIPNLSSVHEFIDSESNIFGNLPKQYWRDVFAVMKRDRSTSTIRISKLLVRPALPDFNKAQ